MTEARRNTMIGLFMVTGVTALGVLMVIFGETPSWLGGAEYEVRIQLRDRVTGIEEGTPVFLNGIKIGRVANLEFIDPRAPEMGVFVVSRIRETYEIPGGVEALCIGPILGLGRGRVELIATQSDLPPIKPGEAIAGKIKSPMDDAIPETMLTSLEDTVISVGNFAEQLTPVAVDLHRLLEMRSTEEVDATAETAEALNANLFTAIQRLDTFIRDLDRLAADPQIIEGIRESVANIRAMTTDGRVAMGEIRQTATTLRTDSARIVDRMDTTIARVDRRANEIADAAIPVLNETAKAAANLRVATSYLAEGKGTVGRLLTDDRLYEVATLSFERALDMIDSLRRLFARFERNGRISFDAMTPIGPVPVDKKLSN